MVVIGEKSGWSAPHDAVAVQRLRNDESRPPSDPTRRTHLFARSFQSCNRPLQNADSEPWARRISPQINRRELSICTSSVNSRISESEHVHYVGSEDSRQAIPPGKIAIQPGRESATLRRNARREPHYVATKQPRRRRCAGCDAIAHDAAFAARLSRLPCDCCTSPCFSGLNRIGRF